jgi:DNA-binding Lrp family transcriptional regulator
MIRCFELDATATASAIAADCGITRQAALKRIARLRTTGALIPAYLVAETDTTLRDRVIVFVETDAKSFRKKEMGISDIVTLADYIRSRALSSPRWKAILEEVSGFDCTMKLESVDALSGAGDWDLAITINAADADFVRGYFVSKLLSKLPGVTHTNTSTVIQSSRQTKRQNKLAPRNKVN